MRIGLDIDDTLTNTKEIFQKYAKKYRRKHHLTENKLNASDFQNFLNTYGTKIYLNMSLKKHADKYIQKWVQEGHEIYFITARSNEEFIKMEVCTKVFLTKYHLPTKHIIFNSKNKFQDGRELHLDVFVDDHESILDTFPKNKMLLLRMISSKDHYSKYIKVTNWKEIDFYIHHH